jgi:hypothetical protein
MLSLLFLTSCNAHNWMTNPATRNGNTDSTTGPCPTGTDPSVANFQVELDQPFDVSWTVNHDGDHWVKVAPLSMEASLETMATSDLVFYQTYENSVPSGSITISGVLEGQYVLQYGWSNYRNCATVQVMLLFSSLLVRT